MSFTRQRSGRSDSARRRPVSNPEVLESRQLLATGMAATYLSPWLPTDQFVTNPITHERELYLATEATEAINPNNPNSPGLVNEGKVISGTDRAGDKWTITVHGPGYAIVTDTTPNDGALDDDIDTIQLVGTSLKSTYVTGNVIASNAFPDIFAAEGPNQPSDGEIWFNQLIATSGVKSIQLNGFDLTDQVTPSVTTPTGVFLYGGVGVLSFNSIIQQQDTSVDTTPYQVLIGEASTPIKVKPSIYLNNITNLVYDGSDLTDPSTTPLTVSSVEFQVNGVLRNFDIISTGQGATPAGFEVYYPPVGTTGRTSVQATAVDTINVHGSAKNLTVSRSTVPFSSSSSGINYLKKATFGGNADGVGLDVKGTIGKLTFKRGLGNPNGVFTGTAANGLQLPETAYGTPKGSTGYPAAGDLGGQIKAARIKKLTVKPANQLVQTAQNPDYVQLQEQGYPTYVPSPGYSITNGIITTSGSISQVSISGTQINTEIKTGFDYIAYLNGLEGTRNASSIGLLKQKGDLINTPVSASFRAANNHYSNRTGTAGPGAITVSLKGKYYSTGGTTGLGNTGSGLFARKITRVGKYPRDKVTSARGRFPS
jgi:hypothetical protein